MSAGRQMHREHACRRLNRPDRPAAIVRGVRLHDGEPADDTENQVAALSLIRQN